MSQSIQPVIAELFLNEKPSGRPIDFEWRLIRRMQRPFLLLPASAMNVRVSLELYSAQRRRAKIWRATLPLLFKTPAAAIFQRVHFQADDGSEIVRFLSEQSGVPVDQLRAPAIKFGGLASEKSRLVLLVCDQTNRPVKVVKLGLNPEGRAATERAADLLAKVPSDTIGCIRMTGRLTTPKISAFATAYFPGESPNDDAGMETLFHSWINPEPAVPVESLDSWQELAAEVAGADPAAWQVLRAALAGKTVRSTLYHGDFAPWNIRAVNSQNLQAFDWERGHLQGIPAWDWFHFIVQTSILARRLSVERVAAEVEELLQSARFEKYAAAAGISHLVKPLVLAYLLHHRWVVKPLEGGKTTAELHELLSARWQLKPQPQLSGHGKNPPAEATASPPGLWAQAFQQLKSAAAQMTNLFWEPSLNSKIQPALGAQLAANLTAAIVALMVFAAVVGAHYYADPHLLFMPFYLIPCALLTWKLDRRWGALAATSAAIIGPLIQRIKDADFQSAEVTGWNIVMRFIILQMFVLFLDRLHRQKNQSPEPATRNHHSQEFADNWAVILAGGLWFAAVVVFQSYSNPNLVFMPLYLIPCVVLTVAVDWRWGTAAAVLAAVASPVVQSFGDADYHALSVGFWNIIMRFLMLQAIVLLLERIRRENVLFFSRHHNGRQNVSVRD